MENQDKLYKEFKDASNKAETKGFDRMEAVWNRVEEKLDDKKKRRTGLYWKYGRVAALLLLCLTVGTFIFRDNNQPVAPVVLPENNITVIDTQKVKDVFDPSKVEKTEQTVVVNDEKDIQQNKTEDSVYYINNTRFNTSKNTTNPQYYFSSKKIKSSPEKTLQTSVTNASIADAPIATVDSKKFTGTISDAAGPIPGASVTVNNTLNSTQTDMDGKFIIEAKKGDIININYLGYKTSQTVLGDDTVAIVMKEDLNNIESVQLNSYRKIPENTAVAAVSTNRNFKRGDSQSYSINDPQKAYSGNQNIVLRGKPVAENISYDALANGRLISRALPESVAKKADSKSKMLNSDYDKYMYENYYPLPNKDAIKGQPGASPNVIIRCIGSIKANNEPLFILNGETVDRKVVEGINPSLFKSAEALKDNAATSLYGNRAYNGVIVLTLKEDISEKDWNKVDDLLKKYPYTEKPITRYIPVDTEEYDAFEENKFENPATAPLSTFSIDVDNASYTNIRRFLNNGQTVPKDAVRVEEMINFFKYQYPQPKGDAPFSINTEYSDAPWNPKHKLLKIGIKGKEIPQEGLPASNFVFLIDVSGSMNSANKLPLLKQSMKLLVNQMRKEDRLAIVVYAGAAGLVLPSTSGAEKDKIIAALDNLSAGGSTAGGAGIELAYKTAQENFIKKGNNRIILATDGDFNVGASSNTDMQTLIEEKRKSGVFLTCLGYGMGNYKDSKMEILADKGNGNYAYIDNMQEATRFLDKEFKGSMYAIAKDVKIQIEFNPKHVQSYRLIGYENRKLRDEDFANDAIDAGELGSGHTVTALYEIIPTGVQSNYFTATPSLKYSTTQSTTGNYNDELATIKFRHKKPDEDKSKEIVQILPNMVIPLKNTSADFKFASAVAWFGLKLRDSKLIPNKETEAIKKLATQGKENDPEGYRAEFIRLVDMVK